MCATKWRNAVRKAALPQGEKAWQREKNLNQSHWLALFKTKKQASWPSNRHVLKRQACCFNMRVKLLVKHLGFCMKMKPLTYGECIIPITAISHSLSILTRAHMGAHATYCTLHTFTHFQKRTCKPASTETNCSLLQWDVLFWGACHAMHIPLTSSTQLNGLSSCVQHAHSSLTHTQLTLNQDY